MTLVNELVQLGQLSDTKIKRAHGIVYEHRVYESVEDKRAYLRIYLENLWKNNWENRGLIIIVLEMNKYYGHALGWIFSMSLLKQEYNKVAK